MNFGALRVLNDDTIDGGTCFGTHPHDNMEIVSIPLEGALEHKDSMGNTSVIQKNEIQVMSAGTGIRHSEYNHNADVKGKFLQIWVVPNKRDVTPRYDQIKLDPKDRRNKFQQIVSPNSNDEGVWIYQDAYFHLADFDKNISSEYKLKIKGNGVYIFVISGKISIACTILEKRDGMGIWETEAFTINSLNDDTEILLMEVPMKF